MKSTIGNCAKIDKRVLDLCSTDIIADDKEQETYMNTIPSKKDIQNTLWADSKKPIYHTPIPIKKRKEPKQKPAPVKIWSKREIAEYEKTFLNEKNNTIKLSDICDYFPYYHDKAYIIFFIIRYFSKDKKYGFTSQEIVKMCEQNNKNINQTTINQVITYIESSILGKYVKIKYKNRRKYTKWIGPEDLYTLCPDSVTQIKKILAEAREKKRKNKCKKTEFKQVRDTFFTTEYEKSSKQIHEIKIDDFFKTHKKNILICVFGVLRYLSGLYENGLSITNIYEILNENNISTCPGTISNYISIFEKSILGKYFSTNLRVRNGGKYVKWVNDNVYLMNEDTILEIKKIFKEKKRYCNKQAHHNKEKEKNTVVVQKVKKVPDTTQNKKITIDCHTANADLSMRDIITALKNMGVKSIHLNFE